MFKNYLTLGIFGLVTVFSFLVTPLSASANVVEDPLGIGYGSHTGLSPHDPRILVGRIINVALGLLGIIAVVLIVYAGFKWMTAGGNEQNVEDAKKILSAAVIGLIIILTAFSISNFILTNLYEATTSAYPSGL